MTLPVYNCLVKDSPDDETGIYAMSFVEDPANETSFVALQKQAAEEFLSRDSQKQILTGVVLRPEQLIYRNSPDKGEHFIKFTADQIEKISLKMMKSGIALYHTTHQHQKPLDGNYLVELWTITDPDKDKSAALGFKDLPKGTLMCSYKIEDKAYWDNEVMAGKVKGFSLEGFFHQEKLNKQNKINSTMKKKNKTLLAKIAHFFLDIEEVVSDDKTDSGEEKVVFTLSDGKQVEVDADGFATLDGTQMPAGEHLLGDGGLLVIDEQGQFVETKEGSATTEDTGEATAAQALSKKNTKPKEKNMNKAVKLEEVPEETIESLKAKIAELEATIAGLQTTAQEAVAEVEQLKKETPALTPVTGHEAVKTQKKISEMKAYEKLAMQAERKSQRDKNN